MDLLEAKTLRRPGNFTAPTITYDFAFGDKDISKMMNDQIAHMNADRTCDPIKKLRAEDMWRVGAAIGRALRHFVENLTDDSRQIWAIRKTGHQEINADYVYLSQTLDASSAAPQVLQAASFTAVAPKFNIIGLEGPKGPTGPLGPR
jgi:hypothetical protein